MRYFRSEKDFGQREDEEASRLVRPKPKIKPPRHDRRREQIRPEQDSDTDQDPDTAKDPDMSLNYKTVGGSFGRVVRRVIAAADDDEFEEWVKTKTFNHPETHNKVQFGSLPKEEQSRIRAKWDTDQKGEEKKPRSKSKPQEGGDSRSESKPESNPQEKNKSKSESESKPGSNPQDGDKLPLAPMQDGKHDDASLAQAGKSIRLEMSKDSKLAETIRDYLSRIEKEDLGSKPVHEYIKSKKIPKNIKTFDDLKRAFEQGEPPAEKFVRDQGHKTPEFVSYVDKSDPTVSVDPKTGEAHFVSEGGDKKGQKVPFDQLPPKQQSRILSEYEKHQKAGKAAESLKGNPAAMKVVKQLLDKKSQLSQSLKQYAKNADQVDVSKAIPDLKDVDLPDGVKSLGDFIRAAKHIDVQPEEEPLEEPKDSSPTKAPSSEIPPPKRNPPNKQEIQRAVQDLLRTFPPKIAARFAGHHPEDIRRIIDDYQSAKAAMSEAKLPNIIEHASKNYHTDPSKVPPPETVQVSRDGKTESVPFTNLSSEEQSQVMQKHRFSTVAHSLAARHSVLKSYKKLGVSPKLAGTVADFALGSKSDSRKSIQKALNKASKLFDLARTEDPDQTPSPKARKGMLASLEGNPGAQVLAVSYFQGSDVNSVRSRYLNHGSVRQISEHDEPEKIYDRLQAAVDEIRKRSSTYPKEVTSQLADPAISFQMRVMDQLRTLSPKKYKKVQALFDHQDARQYDRDYQKFKKNLETWKNQQHDEGNPYRDMPPPRPPQKPSSYYEVKGMSSRQIEEMRKSEEEDLKHLKESGNPPTS